MRLEHRICAIGTLGWLSVWSSGCGGTPRHAVEKPTVDDAPVAVRDGQHDFDFNLGVWKTEIHRLVKSPAGVKSWVTLTGTVTINAVWNGRGEVEEVEADGPTGHFEALTMFLYNPKSHQWNLNFANSSDGMLTAPSIGEFNAGRGEFYDHETIGGKAVFVRQVWSDITPNSHRFEQALSSDGGRTWEPNFNAMLTRAKPGEAHPPTEVAGTPRSPDFDWELGTWKVQMSRLEHPLAGSNAWVKLDGTVAARPLWGGRANLAEIEVDGADGRHLEFLSLRLYNPKSHQWSLNFASSSNGTFGVPLFGEFAHGRGEFYDQEPYDDRSILVKFVFSDATADSSRDEQAFSTDGGKTWEVNWINKLTRIKAARE